MDHIHLKLGLVLEKFLEEPIDFYHVLLVRELDDDVKGQSEDHPHDLTSPAEEFHVLEILQKGHQEIGVWDLIVEAVEEGKDLFLFELVGIIGEGVELD